MARKLDRASVEEILSLTPMQQGMLFHYLVTPESEMYFEQISFRIAGKIDPALVRKAWNLVVETNPSLRAVFRWKNVETPVQIILKQHDVILREFDFSGGTEAERTAKIEKMRVDDRQDKFDLEDVPFRVTLCKLNAEEYEMIVSNHHILYDGWSNTLVLKEFLQAYDALMTNGTYTKPIKHHLKEFIKYLRGLDREKQQNFWQSNLAGFDRNTLLPYDSGTLTKIDDLQLADFKYEISKDLSNQAHQFVKEQQITLATLMYTVWGILLQKHNRTNDVLFGTTVSGRSLQVRGIEDMVGLFMNTVPLRLQAEPVASIFDVLRQVHSLVMERDEFASTPLVDIKEYAQAHGQKQLFDCMVAVENFPLEGLFDANYCLKIKSLTVFEMTNFDLSLSISVADPISVRFKYNSHLFGHGLIEQVAKQFEHILQQIIANPQMQLHELAIVTDAEKQRLLVDFASERKVYKQDKAVPHLVEEQAATTPDAIAVVLGEQSLTYGELNRRANQLAHYLQGQGVGSESLVGVCMERSPEMIVSQLAVLKTGGAYVPMDPTYPQDRLAYLLEDSQVKVLLTQERLLDKLPQHDVATLFVDAVWTEIAKESAENLGQTVALDHLAYVIYTSGSTGLPKGVQVAHGNLLNLVNWHQEAYEITGLDRATLLAGPAFDASVWETWPYLAAGASLWIPDEETRMMPVKLRDWLIEQEITVSFQPTPLAESLILQEWPSETPLRYMLTGGDRLHHRPTAAIPFTLVNHYGPTECTVVTTAGRVEAGTANVAPSIGHPIANMQVYVLDEHRNLVPVGVAGELYVGGDGLTRGYLNRPDLTEATFVPHPFSTEPGARLYRTGDLVRYLPDGSIDFIGRIDNQVKIRGFRIELGEIEAVLDQHSAVQSAVVLAKDDPAGSKRLVAYVVADCKMEEIKRYLQAKLPDYMVPSLFVAMESLPLTANGKIDRRNLPEPESSSWTSALGHVAPRNPLEEMVANIWGQILQVERVGVYDNFFDLGGHSLVANQAVSRLREAFGMDLPVRALFEHPTVGELASHIQAMLQGGVSAEVTPLQRFEREENGQAPLSFAQQRLWFLDRLLPDSALYNIPFVLHVEGELQADALEKSLNVLIERHETLRTTFADVDGQAVQVIAEQLELTLPVIDLRSLEESAKKQEVARLAKEDANTVFDLSRGPLLRATLLQLGAQESVLLLNMHHIISDGWSMGVLMNELTALYEAHVQGQPHSLPELQIQYADFGVWQREWLQGDVMDGQLSYWKEKLQGVEPLLQLPTDRPRPAVQTYDGALYTLSLPKSLGEALNKLSRKEGVTLFMTLLAAFKTLLSRYTRQEDIVVGSPIAGRNRSEVESLIGFFVNTLVLRTDLSGNPTFKKLLSLIRETALEAYAHQDLPFEKIVDELKLERSLSYSPLFQVLFALQNAPLEIQQVEGLTIRPYETDGHVVAKFDLSLHVDDQAEDGLMLIFEYNTDLFDRETIARMASQYGVLLSGIVANPEQKITELAFLGDAEREQLVGEWNDTTTDYPRNQSVQQLYEQQAAATPDKIAVVMGEDSLTYGELNLRANQVAHYLQTQGVVAGSLVGLCMERSLEMIVGLLGILKAGGAYVPLDPAYPAERLAYMLDDSNVSVLLTQEQRLAGLPTREMKTICLDTEWQLIAGQSTDNPDICATGDSLAYVIYTSGSTGQPKGVCVPHRGIVRLVKNTQYADFSQDNVFLQLATVSFDAATFEIWGSLLNGARLAMMPPHMPSLEEIGQAVREYGVTTMWLTVGLFNLMVDNDLGALRGVKQLLVGGDALSMPHIRKAFTLEGTQLINGYGPTESTTFTCCHPIREQDLHGASIPIGRPIANTQVYVLDEQGQPVPIGVPGELHIGGDGLAIGYLNRPDLTEEKFVVNPFSSDPEARLYKTGDLVRYLPDGNIEFIGRIDNQVKIRGFRIELGEIEAALSKHPAVLESTVLVQTGASGEKRIAAYLVTDPEVTCTTSDVLRFLKDKLPDYMVPSFFIMLDSMPLTPNGKIDRKALPAPDFARIESAQAYTAPRTESEQKLAEIWQQVLRLEQVGIHDNFFELGGDSILSIQIVSRANQSGMRLTPKQMFEYQTIAELAEAIELTAGTVVEIAAEQGIVTGEVPLLPIQQWFFEQNFANQHHWNQSMLLTVKKPLERARLTRAVQELLAHHDALRLRFVQEAGEWKQVNHGLNDDVVPFEVIDLSEESEPTSKIETLAAEAQASLQLENGPLMRVVYFDLGAERQGRLLIVIHHLAVDGVSWRILLEDLQQAYEQAGNADSVKLAPKTTAYKQWAEKLVEHAKSDALQQEMAYWLAQTEEASQLPVDHPEGANTEASMESVTLSLTVEETRALLQDVPAAYRTQINDVLLTALVQATAPWTGKRSLLVNLEGHGREEVVNGVDLSRTVGWFTTMYPVRIDLGKAQSLAGALKSVKEQVRNIPNKGIGYGLLRYLSGACETLQERPHAEISFNYLGQFDQVVSDDASPFAMATEERGAHSSAEARRSHLLDVSGVITGGQLNMTWMYSRDLHQRTTMDGLAERFMAALRAIIAHCQSEEAFGYTPSDFPLATLNQQQLDRVIDGNRSIENVYPMTPLQQGLLFHTLYEQDGGDYVVQLSLTFEGEFDTAKFEQSWQKAVDRHAILRTIFAWEGMEEPHQVVWKQVNLAWEHHDWQNETDEEQQAHLQTFLQEDRAKGFDFSKPPMRFYLIRLGDNTCQFVWSHHHVLLDGWSLPLVLNDVFALYNSLCSGEMLELAANPPFANYIGWLQRQSMEEAENFWREMLAGFTAPTPIGTGSVHPVSTGEEAGKRYGRQSLYLSEEQTGALQELARRNQLTLNTIVQGAWALLLSRYSGEADVVFGATGAGRPADLPGVESMVGLFINTLPVRVKVAAQDSVTDWLKQLQERQVEIRQYEYSPLVNVQSWSEVPQGVPLFESLYVFENYPVAESTGEAFSNLTISNASGMEQTNYPVTLVAAPGPQLWLRFMYDQDRLDDVAVERMLGHLASLLDGMATQSDARVTDLSMLTQAEREQLLSWNDSTTDYPRDKSVQELFVQQAEATPDAIAVVMGEETLTYGELNRRANQLAHYLQAQGVGVENLVGLCMERSLEMIVGLLAILKAGAAYVPLDPAYPKERLTYMLEDSQVALLITQERLLEKLPPHQATTICLDSEWDRIAEQSGDNLPITVTADNLAYVIYTSGSTGQPKGVLVLHRGIVRLVKNTNYVDFTSEQVLLQMSTISFDAATFEIWGSLLNGAKLVMMPPHMPTLEEIGQAVQRYGATTLFITSGLFNLMVDSHLDGLRGVKKILTGGEAMSIPHIRKAFALTGTSLANIYGPTESTTYTSYYPISEEDLNRTSIPIGRPIANTQVYVLDEQGQPVPIGVPGELHIGGDGLARGYLNRPDLTEEKFIANPFSSDPEARLYKTGDLVRFLPDGNIDFIGRIDNQVKIRGFRIELGEIEAVLIEHEDVQKVVVLVREDVPGDKRLVAYVEADRDLSSALRQYLKGKMPEYMIPSAFITLDSLPLNANGKIDKKALPAPDQSLLTLDKAYVAPRNPEEELVANIWAQVLHLNQVGVSDNFFELGGHSLLATQAVSRLREAFGVEVALRVLFDNPTVAELAAHLQAVRRGETQAAPIVPRDRDGLDLPLSFAQQRLWFLDRFMPDSALYNIPTVLRIEGELNTTLLESSLQMLIDRHESLRTTFAEVDGKAVQVIAPKFDFLLPIEDLSALEGTEQDAAMNRLTQEDAVAPFDLTRGPLMRAKLLQLGTQTFVLLLNMHHIISDGWSLGVFLRELTTVYEGLVQGKQPMLPELPVQYADFAVWQREWLQGEVLEEQMSYWKQKLQGSEPLLQLPTDRSRPAEQTYNGTACTVVLPNSLAERLTELSRQEGVTLFMTLLAAFKTLLYRYTMQEDILVGSPNAGRNRSEIEGLIGFFVNTLVLRSDLSGNPTFKELLAQVRDTSLEAYAHQDLPFEKIVDELQPERSLSYSPLFQVFFALQNALLDFESAEGLNMTIADLENIVTSKYDLSLYCLEREDGFYTTFEYNTDLFDESTILKIASHFETLLTAIVANPDQSIRTLQMLGEQELQQLDAWNDNKLAEVPNGCIQQLVEAQAACTPDAVALVVDTESITYAELNQRANRLAHYLQKQGVTAGSLVGVCTERTVDMVVGLLGVLKSSAAYVPLDPMYPQDRIAYTLEDAQVSVLLTQDRLVADLPAHNAHVVRLDADWNAIAAESAENPVCIAKPDDLAYVIYTSGSTGRPKGVAIEHRNAVTFIAWAQGVFSEEQLRGVLASTSICFDLSVYELFVTLSTGGKVILAENALYLPMLPAKDEVTLINTVPSAAAELVRMNGIPQSVRTVNLAGEPLPNALAQQLYATGHVQEVYNLYGPSEDTTYSTYALVVKGAETAPTIGRPIANTEAYLLDQNGQQVPIGVPGELHLAGDGLARGYLYKPEMTAEKFIANPFSNQPGARMYRTGDLARFLPNGELEYMGRIDHQVKVRGFRIELGEIETVLAAHPAVRETVVVVREDKPNEKRIVAYLAGDEQEIAELRRFVKEKLPDYMVPSAFVWLEALPLTPNGKVDRKALPVPEIRVEPVQEGTAAATDIERLLTEIWCSVLGLSQVGIHDNFFELGGDSILSIQIVARLNQTGWRVTPKQMFQNQTIAELAATIEKNKIDLPEIVAEQGLVTGEVALLPIQKWFFEQEHPNPHHWNQSMMLTVKRPLDPADLQVALSALLAHHDALRLRFEQEAGVWKQVNTAASEEVPLQVVDLSDHPVAELKQAIENAALEAQSSLHLTDGPLLRAVYFDLGADLEARLLLVIHHLAVDGVSWRILLEDLQNVCEQLRAGSPVGLPRKTTSYKEWSEKMSEYVQSDSFAEESRYWLSLNTANVASIPREYASGANTEGTAEEVAVTLSADETKTLLSEALSKHRANMDEVLLTALGWALSKWARKGSYLVHLEGHGREEIVQGADLSRTVGWFTTMYPVLLDLGNSTQFTDALKSVKDQLRAIPSKGTGYGLLRYMSPNLADAQALRNKPQADISFNYLGQFDQVVSGDSLFTTASESPGPNLSPTAKRPHLLDFVAVIIGGELRLTCFYGAQFHKRQVIETLVRDLAEGVRWFVSPEGRESFGFTASDFQEADIDQASLNKVLKKLKGKGR